ncbi:alpha/beta hydrolase [Halopseudomonas nanhaiensis]|uniref:alpha/beta fold hydrolase n=1 Tax=Halopseudomonas nanhaiensis TaxID=2830842 RepID=UPI001CBB2772|nr:alpha/beta hydrolase [Halopseudomonas nanhaiensis]UAW97394.1 alpha/beta hydrolase [Halopseudomonas nanhaiensis]
MSTFTSFDGTRIFYQQWGRRSSSRPPVVLHHGYVANARANWLWTGIVGRLTANGHKVIALDARGHGRSTKHHDPARYGEATMAQDVSALLDHLSLDQVDLVGYSMGATVALIAASEDPRIRRLAVGGIGAHTTRLGRGRKNGFGSRLAKAMLAPSVFSVRDPMLAGFRIMADALWADRKALAAQALAFHNKRIAFDRIDSPTLIIAGNDDPFAHQPEVLQRAIEGARLQLMPGNHTNILTKPAFREALVAFLR